MDDVAAVTGNTDYKFLIFVVERQYSAIIFITHIHSLNTHHERTA